MMSAGSVFLGTVRLSIYKRAESQEVNSDPLAGEGGDLRLEGPPDHPAGKGDAGEGIKPRGVPMLFDSEDRRVERSVGWKRKTFEQRDPDDSRTGPEAPFSGIRCSSGW